MAHTFSELRNAVLDILSGREKPRSQVPANISNLGNALATLFNNRNERTQPTLHNHPELLSEDDSLLVEVWWGLFREGIVIPGGSGHDNYPWFRITQFGQRILDSNETYFFHDVSSFEKLIRDSVPNIDDTTMVYLKEAMQAFLSSCVLSASVMLGVASEHTFNLLLETAMDNPAHEQTFAAAAKERSALRRFNVFKSTLDAKIAANLPPEIREDLDTQFAAILAVIRNYRNESGHPSGKLIEREQAYVLLNLFPSYCKKVYQLRDWLAQ